METKTQYAEKLDRLRRAITRLYFEILESDAVPFAARQITCKAVLAGQHKLDEAYAALLVAEARGKA